MSSILKPLTEYHFSRLVDLWEASVRATHHFLTEQDIQFFKPLIRESYLSVLMLVGVTTPSGDLAGFIGIDGDKIEMLFIHPDYFSQGYGAMLINHAIVHMHATKVDVNEDNPGATAFYAKMGFKLVGRSPRDSAGKPFPILHMER